MAVSQSSVKQCKIPCVEFSARIISIVSVLDERVCTTTGFLTILDAWIWRAKHDTVDVIRAEKSTHGILHCFTEDWETAKAVLDCGYYVSFSGIVSFKNAQDLRDVAKQVPLDRVLIETDSPYLAPMPYRGKSNEPKYVPYVAKALSDVYDKSIEEIAFITMQNFENLLNLK